MEVVATTENLRVIVYHAGYGCETGCCGHVVALIRPNGTEADQSFVFIHPDEDQDLKAWAVEHVAREFGEDHVADLDWENCLVESYDTCPM